VGCLGVKIKSQNRPNKIDLGRRDEGCRDPPKCTPAPSMHPRWGRSNNPRSSRLHLVGNHDLPVFDGSSDPSVEVEVKKIETRISNSTEARPETPPSPIHVPLCAIPSVRDPNTSFPIHFTHQQAPLLRAIGHRSKGSWIKFNT
jgi:hypothetical protein